MKTSNLIFCVVTLTVSFAASVANAHAAPVVPAEPGKLLAMLPPVELEGGWRLASSQATNSARHWPSASATRVYEGPILEEKTSGLKNSGTLTVSGTKPATVIVRLTDTGGYEPSLVLFSNFSAGDNRVIMRGNPAIRETAPDIQRITINIANRFLLAVYGKNCPPQAYEKILGAILDKTNFAAFHSAPNNGVTFKSPFLITKIDELHPEKNRSYYIYWGQNEDE